MNLYTYSTQAALLPKSVLIAPRPFQGVIRALHLRRCDVKDLECHKLVLLYDIVKQVE